MCVHEFWKPDYVSELDKYSEFKHYVPGFQLPWSTTTTLVSGSNSCQFISVEKCRNFSKNYYHQQLMKSFEIDLCVDQFFNHSFKKNISTTMNLFCIPQFIINVLDSPSQISKAFQKLYHTNKETGTYSVLINIHVVILEVWKL